MKLKEIVTWFILLTLLLIFFNNLFLNNGISLIKVTGTSMCPTNGKFSLSLLKEITSPNDLVINNVYVFDYYPNESTQHRLVDIIEDEYVFSGDNSRFKEYVKYDKIKYNSLANLPIIVC